MNNDIYADLLGRKTKKYVYQWELNYIKDWSLNDIRNRIWMSTQCGQPIPGCVSAEALRMELYIRGETPNGYHENPEEIDISNIEIINANTRARKSGR
ncbi:MAG: hypothetical protein PHY47_09580 [Lachnospiraceae bacterium]|nr:hypothetical protein [Lachnospiraceae bacterium]